MQSGRQPEAGQAEAAEAPELESAPEFSPIEREMVALWRLRNTFSSLVLLLVLPVLGVPVLVAASHVWPLLLLAWGLLALLALCYIALWPPLAWEAWGWRIDDRVLETRHGVVFQVRQLVPLNRLQHVDLHSGPLERRLGLASLIFYTAGAQHGSVMLPGLARQQAERLRDRLVEVGGDDGV